MIVIRSIDIDNDNNDDQWKATADARGKQCFRYPRGWSRARGGFEQNWLRAKTDPGSPIGHTTSIITSPFATSPNLMSRFSMVSICRRIDWKNTAVCPNVGKVRDQYFSHILHISCIRAPRSQVTAHSSSKNCTQKSSSSRQICAPMTSRTSDTPKLLGFRLLTFRRTLGDRSYRSIPHTDGYAGKMGFLPI